MNANETELREATTTELEAVDGGHIYDFVMQAIRNITEANLQEISKATRDLRG